MNLKRIHSTSVVIDDNGVLILGDSGSGKSDLALRLIDNGATLISDDISICRKNSNNIYLYCPPEIKGLLEVREIGIITVPFVERIKLRLVVNLKSNNNERFPKDSSFRILGIKIPIINIEGKNSSAVAKIKVKLNEIRETI
ncbi:MAG: HPr kinase [Alphaproteobacteria bacterium]|nr:MAG: HPr kinase [Alphaproteobacteria bacterium]